MKKNTFKVLSLIIFFIAMALLTVIAIPLIKSYNNPEEFKAFIESFGPKSLIIMFFVQIAQIVVALIPGEVVEFVAGTLYGWFGGFIFCSVGILIGEFLIFKTVRTLGKDFVEKVAGSDAMHRFRFLQDEKKLKSIIFILFFIPGTPKDLITYVAPLTKIKLRDFLVLTVLARIPSVLSSTYAGDAFSDKDFVQLAIVYSAIILVSIGGVIFYRMWEEKHTKKEMEEKK